MTRARPFSTGSPCYQENGTEGDQYEAGPIRSKSKATTTLPRLQCVTLRRRPPSAEPPVPDRLSCHVHHSAKNKECTKQDDKHSRLPVVSATRIQASFASTPPISSTETGLGQHPTRQRPRSSGERARPLAGADWWAPIPTDRPIDGASSVPSPRQRTGLAPCVGRKGARPKPVRGS
jgi:hypothetical protein